MWTTIINFFRQLFDTTPQEEEQPFEIVDIINTLPWHETRTWSKRALNKITKVVVHQSLTPMETTTLESINNYHVTPGPQNHLSPNGAPHIAYHFGIDSGGKVYRLNNLSHSTWHCKNHNTSAIGILLVGDFSGPTYEGTDVNPTREQLINLQELLDYLVAQENLTLTRKDVFGHNDFGKENCPGNLIANFIGEYNKL